MTIVLNRVFFIMLVFFSGVVFLHAEDSPQQFQGFTLDGYTDGGHKAWDVKGDTADVSGNTIELTNPDANSYGKDNVNIKAKTGSIDKESGQMHLEKDVVITTQSGARMTTNSLDWEREKDLVTTNDRVKITRDDIIAEAMGAIAHPNLQTGQMNKDVTVELRPKPDKDGNPQLPVTITCDGPLEIDQLKQQATFNKNVVAVQEGRELKADKVEVFFDQTTKQIKQMICTGHVAITQGGNTTYSESAVYTAGDQKMILSGRPKLILQTQGGQFASPGN